MLKENIELQEELEKTLYAHLLTESLKLHLNSHLSRRRRYRFTLEKIIPGFLYINRQIRSSAYKREYDLFFKIFSSPLIIFQFQGHYGVGDT